MPLQGPASPADAHAPARQVKRDLAVKRATVTGWWHGLLMLLKYRATKNVRDGNYLGPRCVSGGGSGGGGGGGGGGGRVRLFNCCWVHCCWLPLCLAA